MVQTIVGGKTFISEDTWVWALSLGCNFKYNHAFLVLEGLKKQQRIIKIAELGYDTLNKAKAIVYFKDFTGKPGKGICYLKSKSDPKRCKSITLQITFKQKKKFEELVLAYKKLAQNDKLNYIRIGNAKIPQFFQASVENITFRSLHQRSVERNNNLIAYPAAITSRDPSKEKIEKIHKGTDPTRITPRNPSKAKIYKSIHNSTDLEKIHNSFDLILRQGHNCMSFAKEIWRSLGLPYTETMLGKYFVVVPKRETESQLKSRDTCVLL